MDLAKIKEAIYNLKPEYSELKVGNIVEIDNTHYEIVRIKLTSSQFAVYGITLPDIIFDTIVFDEDTPYKVVRKELTGRDLGDLVFNNTNELYIYDNEGHILKHEDCDEYTLQAVNLGIPFKHRDIRYIRLKLDEPLENQEPFVIDFIKDILEL